MCYINYSTFWERTRKERKKKKSYISLTVLMGIFHRDSWPNCFEVGKLIFNNNNDYYIICCSLFICIIWRREDCVENQVFNKSNMQRIVLSARMVTFFFFFNKKETGATICGLLPGRDLVGASPLRNIGWRAMYIRNPPPTWYHHDLNEGPHTCTRDLSPLGHPSWGKDGDSHKLMVFLK